MAQLARFVPPAPPGRLSWTDAERLDAWLVDLDGTLYHAWAVKVAMVAELLLFAPHKLCRVRAFRDQHELLRADPGAPAGDPYVLQLQRTATALGVAVQELERDVRTWMIERPKRYLRWFRRTSLLSRLRSFRLRGGKTALVSDYPALEKLGALGARELFDVVVASGEPDGPRRLKPDADGYRRAAHSLGVPPERCLVIGDRDDGDGVAARALGMAFLRP